MTDRLTAIIRRIAWPVFCLLLIGAMVLLGMIFPRVYDDVREFTSAGRRNGIGMMTDMPPTSWALPKSTSPAGATEPVAELEIAEDNGVRHFTDRDRRKAASYLAESGDLEGALSLLNADKDVRALSRNAGEIAVANLRRDLPGLWEAQLNELTTYWAELDDPGKPLLYTTERQDSAKQLTAFLAADAADRHAIISCLPESLWFTMLNNVHAGLSKDSPLPPTVIRLYLEPMSRQERFANRLYWKTETFQKTSLSEHAAFFSRSVDASFLWPILKDAASADQTRLASGDTAMVSWLETVWGVRFCADLRGFDFSHRHAHLLFPWRSLLPVSRKLWADRLGREFTTQMGVTLAPAVLLRSDWLKDRETQLDTGFVLESVRDYPEWQRALREFDYVRAEQAAFDALKILRAGWYFVRTSDQGKDIVLPGLMTDLEKEKRAFVSKNFPWLELIAELGGVNEGVPMAIRRERNWSVKPRTTGVLWKDVKPGAVILALRQLAQKHPGRQRIYEKLIVYYATNRNITVKHIK